MQGVNQHNMSETNKFLVLKTIASKGPISRITLSRDTHLSKMTITSLINDFLQKGFVRECGTTVSTAGRRPTLLEAVPDSLLTLGISVGRDFLQVGIVDLTGAVTLSDQVPTSQFTTEDGFLNALGAMCDTMLQSVPEGRVWGIGISSIGPINITDGIILDPPDFGIGNIHIVPHLKQRYDLPVYIENDMAVSALAEMYYGAGKPYTNFVYVGVTAGIGSGVIINQRLYSGTNGLASILGHTIVVADGDDCPCGQKGCLEAMSSVRATLAWARAHGLDGEAGWMDLLARAQKGDEVCAAALERMQKYLATGLVNVVNLYDPECILMGGDLWFAGEEFFLELQQQVNSRSMAAGRRPEIPVLRGHFPGNAYFIGTAALVMENNQEYRKANGRAKAGM